MTSPGPCQLSKLAHLKILNLEKNQLAGTMPDFDVELCAFKYNCLFVPSSNKHCISKNNYQKPAEACPPPPEPVIDPSGCAYTRIDKLELHM